MAHGKALFDRLDPAIAYEKSGSMRAKQSKDMKSITKYFYKYKPLRSLTEIRVDILALEEKTKGLLWEIIK